MCHCCPSLPPPPPPNTHTHSFTVAYKDPVIQYYTHMNTDTHTHTHTPHPPHQLVPLTHCMSSSFTHHRNPLRDSQLRSYSCRFSGISKRFTQFLAPLYSHTHTHTHTHTDTHTPRGNTHSSAGRLPDFSTRV